jgi:hypothetical protein
MVTGFSKSCMVLMLVIASFVTHAYSNDSQMFQQRVKHYQINRNHNSFNDEYQNY